MTDLEAQRMQHYELNPETDAEAEPCGNCGHEESNHHDPPFTSGHPCAGGRVIVEGYCFCSGYRPRDAQDEADAADDAASERADRARE